MGFVPAIGATFLGIVVGWLIRFFSWRFEKFSPSVLSAVISMIVGGGIVKFLGPDPSAFWFYPVGLLLGFVISQVNRTALVRNLEKRSRSMTSSRPHLANGSEAEDGLSAAALDGVLRSAHIYGPLT